MRGTWFMACALLVGCGENAGTQSGDGNTASETAAGACADLEDETCFSEQYADRVCAEWELCDPDASVAGCGEETTSSADMESCTYSPDKAEECLDGEWMCQEAGGIFYVELPLACSQVFTNCE